MENNISTSFNSVTGSYELSINGQVFSSLEEDEFIVPMSVIEDISINEFPIDVTLQLDPDNMPEFNDELLILPRIKNTTGETAYIDFNYCPEAKYVVHYNIGYPIYQEALVELLLLNKKNKLKILANSFDGNSFHFHCSIELLKDSIGNLFIATLDFFYTARWSVLENSTDFPTTLRKKLKLPVKPSRRAKIQIMNDAKDKVDMPSYSDQVNSIE